MVVASDLRDGRPPEEAEQNWKCQHHGKRIDKNAISSILKNPVNIVDVLNSEARKAMELKKLAL